MATRQTSDFSSRYGGNEKTGYAVEHQDEELNHILENAKERLYYEGPGIALEPGESNAVDMTLAIPEWMATVDVRCTMVLTKRQGGPDQVWTRRSPQDISVRTSNGE